MLFHRLRSSAAFLMLAAVSLSSASAQTRSVYGSGVDEDAALVRFVNAGSPDAGVKRVGAQSFDIGARGSATAYKAVYPDIYMFEASGKSYEFMPESGAFYTIALCRDGAVVFKDERHADPAKAQLYFYQLAAGKQAALKTADGSVAVSPSLAYGASFQVAVNAIAARLAVFLGAAKASEDISIAMERGASYAVFYVPGGVPAAFVVKAAVSTD